MYIISVVLYGFWVFIFIAAGNKLFEVIKFRDTITFREWILIIGCLLMPVWFFVERFFLNTP